MRLLLAGCVGFSVVSAIPKFGDVYMDPHLKDILGSVPAIFPDSLRI